MEESKPFRRDMTPREKPWEELTIADNFIFQLVMRKKRCCKRFLENVLDMKIQKITYPVTEKDIKMRRDRKGVRLDVYVEDDKGNLYDIEMQTVDYATPDELPKRTRYYQAMIDMDVLNRGEFYTKLRRTFIIFVCTFDPFGYDRSVYTFKETCQEDGSILMGDETTKLFLNSKGSRGGVRKELATFLDYVEGKAPAGSFTCDLAKEGERAKENKEMKVEYMTFNMELRRREELGRTEGRAEGRVEGRAEGIRSILKQLVKEGTLTVEAAAGKMGVTVEEFRKLSMQ